MASPPAMQSSPCLAHSTGITRFAKARPWPSGRKVSSNQVHDLLHVLPWSAYTSDESWQEAGGRVKENTQKETKDS